MVLSIDDLVSQTLEAFGTPLQSPAGTPSVPPPPFDFRSPVGGTPSTPPGEQGKLGPGPHIISIEAAIGCGKSTLLGLLAERFGSSVRVVYEPLERWQNVETGDVSLFDHHVFDQGIFFVVVSPSRGTR